MKIQRKSITEQVYEILQRGIESGRFKPGERIREDRLATKLSVSKTPLRIALHQLKESGLVRIDARLGIFLATPTEEEVAELVEMREVLEGLAARRAARHSTDKFIAKLRGCFAGFTEHNLMDDRQAYAGADHKFHSLIIAAAESAELQTTLKTINLRLHMNRLRRSYSRGHDLTPIHREHLAIIEALDARDSPAAENLVRAHIRGIAWRVVVNEAGVTFSAKTDAA